MSFLNRPTQPLVLWLWPAGLCAGVASLVCPTLMEGASGRMGLAERVLDWAEDLG